MDTLLYLLIRQFRVLHARMIILRPAVEYVARPQEPNLLWCIILVLTCVSKIYGSHSHRKIPTRYCRSPISTEFPPVVHLSIMSYLLPVFTTSEHPPSLITREDQEGMKTTQNSRKILCVSRRGFNYRSAMPRRAARAAAGLQRLRSPISGFVTSSSTWRVLA
jgi:hypothetical protein